MSEDAASIVVADLAAKAAAGDKALVEVINEEAAPEAEPEVEITQGSVPEETASEPVAEDKPQE